MLRHSSAGLVEHIESGAGTAGFFRQDTAPLPRARLAREQAQHVACHLVQPPARIHMARDMGPGHTLVTVLCDYGTRYQSKLFNPEFLQSKGLPVPTWLDRAPTSIPGVFEDV